MSEASRIEDVLLPGDVVELKKLRTKSGDPVRVSVRFLDEIAIYNALGSTGGYAPPYAEAAKDDAEKVRDVATMVHLAEPLIEAGCYLLDSEGREVPAFSFSNPPEPGRIPGHMLSVADKSDLYVAVLRVAGLVGGTVEKARFPDDAGERPPSVGAVDVVPTVEDVLPAARDEATAEASG